MRKQNTELKHWNTQYFKLGAAVLITVGICAWVIYGLLKPDVTPKYGDFAIDSAVAWLKNADRGNFDVCRKNIVDHDGWFDWFVKDRKIIGSVMERKLNSRRELQKATKGMKRYGLTFISKFSSAPKRKVMEQVTIETDGKKSFKIFSADCPVSYTKSLRPEGVPEKMTERLTRQVEFENTGVVEIFRFVAESNNVKITLSDRVIASNPKISLCVSSTVFTAVKYTSKAANLKFKVTDDGFFIDVKDQN
ncbi:MAG: hypothetical protein WCS27_09195 [Victivallaceae bacterium]